MIKYELIRNSREINYKDRGEIKPGCTLDADDLYQHTVSIFDSEEEALKALSGCRTSINQFSTPIGIMYDVEEYYIEENVYDDDDDSMILLSNIIGFSDMENN